MRSSGVVLVALVAALAACGGTGGLAGADDGDDDGPALDRDPPVTTASPAGGPTVQAPVTVTLTSSEPAEIRYTLDGSEPGPASPVYAAPLVLERTTTLRFFAVDRAGNAERPRRERYRIDVVRRLLLQVGSS